MAIDLVDVTDAVESNLHIGFCTLCYQKYHGIDYDARNEICFRCGKAAVFSARELLLAAITANCIVKEQSRETRIPCSC